METFTPFVQKTDDITTDINNVAEKFNIKNNEVDFEIISHKTYYSHNKGKKQIVDISFTDEQLVKSTLEFHQEYEIKIQPKIRDTEFKIVSTLAINKNKTLVYLFIDPVSVIPLKNSSIKKMINYILKKKLRLGLFVDIFEPDLELEVKKFLKVLKTNNKLLTKYKMLVSSAVEPEQQSKSEMVFHYKRKKKRDSQEKYYAFKDELVAEYIKIKKTKGGRSCLGKYILPLKPDIVSSHNIEFNTESILIEENDNTINYYANFEGEVKYEENTLRIIENATDTEEEEDFPNRQLNILVVDDALIIRRSLKKMLEQLGHNVVAESKDGIESILDYVKYKPDLVTMDITMPNMNGIEAVGEIKKIDPDAKIIMVTSHGQEEMVIGAIKAGAKGYLLKPITIPKIIHELQKFSLRQEKKQNNSTLAVEEDDDDDDFFM